MITNTLRRSVGSAVTRIAIAAFVLMLALTGLAAQPRGAEASGAYATLCTDINYQGTCRTYYQSIPSLGNTEIGNDKLSSLKLPAGMRVVLFEHNNYAGRCQAFTAAPSTTLDIWTLVGSYIANDQASSVGFGWFSCPTPAVPVYAGGPFGSMNIYSSVDNLGATPVGNDKMAWLLVPSGTTVAVYSDINFEGTCQTFVGDGKHDSLDDYLAYRASSIALNHSCEQDVQLCVDRNLWGRCVSFRSDKPYLGDTDLGNDTASSLRVPTGWAVTVYSDKDYLGLRDPYPSANHLIQGYEPDEVPEYKVNFELGLTTVPDEAASSIKVSRQGDCIGKTDPRCISLIPGL